MKSFLADRPRINLPSPSASAAPSAGAFAFAGTPGSVTHPAAEHGGGTHIECVREGDRITRLVITCACGERIEIDCLYAAGK